MKKTLLALAFVLTTSLPGALAADAKPSPASEYQKAVKSYLDAASSDLTAVREGIEASAKNATEGAKLANEQLAAAFQRCEKLLADLKKSTQADFDRIKADYEKARVTLGKQLEVSRRS